MNDLLFDDAPTREPVPNVVGMTEDEARVAIVDAGFEVGRVDREPSETVPADTVIEQDPNRDTFQDPGTSVSFVLSVGKPEVEVPFVVGSLRKEARAQLVAANLEVRFEEQDSDEPKFQVLSTNPAPGTAVAEGTTVVVVYSAGPSKVPDVRGLKQGAAEQAIREAGFVPDVRVDAASVEPKGTVVRPDPRRRDRRPGQHGDDLRVGLRGAPAADRDPDRDADAADRDADGDPDGADREPDHAAAHVGQPVECYSGIGVA